jgi:hypothetical protein
MVDVMCENAEHAEKGAELDKGDVWINPGDVSWYESVFPGACFVCDEEKFLTKYRKPPDGLYRMPRTD